MNFLYFLSSYVFVIYSPFCVLLFKSSNLGSEVLPETKMLLFKSGYNILKPSKFCLKNRIYIGDVLQRSLFKLNQSLFHVRNLNLYYVLSTENKTFNFF